jgi:hypothetical protein
MNQAWIDSLKVGDEVVFSSRYRRYELVKITKITPTRKKIELSNNRVLGSDGYEKGDAWGAGSITPITQQILDSIKRKNLLMQIENFNFRELSIEKLEQVLIIMKTE